MWLWCYKCYKEQSLWPPQSHAGWAAPAPSPPSSGGWTGPHQGRAEPWPPAWPENAEHSRMRQHRRTTEGRTLKTSQTKNTLESLSENNGRNQHRTIGTRYQPANHNCPPRQQSPTGISHISHPSTIDHSSHSTGQPIRSAQITQTHHNTWSSLAVHTLSAMAAVLTHSVLWLQC